MTDRDDSWDGIETPSRRSRRALLPITDPRRDAILDDFRHSGLTHAGSCRRGVPLHTFRKRLYQDRDANTPAVDPSPLFLPVTVVPDTSGQPATTYTPLELILSHGRLGFGFGPTAPAGERITPALSGSARGRLRPE